MKLIKYRDAGLPTYTYFWISENNQVLSPYFDQREQAETWLSSKTDSSKISQDDTSKEN